MKNRIKELRLKQGVKQLELARYLGVAQNTLSYWEQGKYEPDNESLQKIADYFKCSIDYILLRDTSSETKDIDEEKLKFALFGGDGEITDEMFDEVKRYAQFIKEHKKNGGA